LGLVFFAKGFLLTRLVLDTKSECRVLPDGSQATVEGGCWHPKTFDRAVIIIIDALRYDFTIPTEAAPPSRAPGFYLDNLPLLYSTASSHPEHAFLLPFIADPPTTTLQRLKGLTTGTLPVFIDAGSNFAGTAIEEDNFVSQLRDAGKTLVHLGDDTWHSLFPGYFDANQTHAYDSFNVWDLHTVDNGVIQHIMPLLQQGSRKTWDVIFAHFLGVDHAGHRYGPDHQAMADKLAQMNTVLKDIADSIDDDTLLVVMGDHGMDKKGDHGGESDEEVEAALWVYSKKPRFGRTEASHALPPSTAKDRPVGQIDLVSTLSLLLGLPVPFNNLGTPIPEAFIGPGNANWETLASAELHVFSQLQKYQSQYSQSRDLGVNEVQRELHGRVGEAMQDTSSKRWTNIHKSYRAWHRETIRTYRNLWASFNIADMLHGVELLAIALISLVCLSRLLNADKANLVPRLLRNIGLGTVTGAAVGPLLSIIVPDHFTTITGAGYGFGAGSLFGALWTTWEERRYIALAQPFSFWGWLSLVFCLTQSAGFAANSFTIHEDTILLFFLTTFGALCFISSLRQASNSDRALGAYQSAVFMLLSRAASVSRLCREEQMPGCRSTFYASSTSSTSAPWQLLIPFLTALVLPELIKAFYTGTASWSGSAAFWLGFSFRMGLVIIALYWTLDAADNGDWLSDTFPSSTLRTVNITLARCALAVALPVGFGTFVWAKPCIDISLDQRSNSNAGADGPSTKITILGYANIYGSRYFLMLPMLILCISLLLPPMGQFSIAICAWQILCLLEILDTNGLSITQVSNSSIGPVVLAMLGSYHFFKTGHQAVLSSIQWNSAFVPLRTIGYPWSPLLVMLNTFGAQMLCAAAVPLTVLWKRPISKDGLRGIWSDVTNACLTHMLYYATIQLATTMWAGHLRRHLMLYRVFMPRYLMASAVLVVVDIVLIFCALSGARVAGLSVGEIFGY
jgi:GPI ethanolamine phosphate transferase 3 subunit O